MLDEYDVAKAWGHKDPDTYFMLERDVRKGMVGHARLKSLIESMTSYDQSKKQTS